MLQRIDVPLQAQDADEVAAALGEDAQTVLTLGRTFAERAYAALDDDFNTSQAIAVLFDLAREINKASGRASEAQATLLELAGLLGLTLTGNESDSNEAGPFIELLIETRAALRKERQFALADQVRDRLIEMGVALEDTANGTEWGYRRS